MTTKIYRQVLYRQELSTKICLQQREEQEAASVSTTLKSVLNITALNSVYYRWKICALV